MPEQLEYQDLFKEIRDVTEKHRIELAERRKRGELFNVFQVLGLTEDEVRTHSAFIAELLNPEGAHGMGSTLLSLFVEAVNTIVPFKFDCEKAKVRVEKFIGHISENYEDGGRLDILVHSGNKAILIENKINADDQFKQLVRYYKFGQSHYKGGFVLLYLNKEGRAASPGSETGDEITLESGTHYFCISYRDEIRDWLQRCLSVTYDKPIVRESIIQYLSLINGFAGAKDMKEEDIIRIMSSHPEEVKEILNYQYQYMDYAMELLRSQFEQYAKENHFVIIYDGDFYAGKKESSISFRKADWKNAVISIIANKTQSNYWIAIKSRPGADLLATPLKRIESLTERPDKAWPFGWRWLPDGYNSGIFKPGTVADIITGKYIKTIGELISHIASDFESIPNYREI